MRTSITNVADNLTMMEQNNVKLLMQFSQMFMNLVGNKLSYFNQECLSHNIICSNRFLLMIYIYMNLYNIQHLLATRKYNSAREIILNQVKYIYPL